MVMIVQSVYILQTLFPFLSQNKAENICDPGAQNQSLGYICSNSQKYIIWVKMIDLSFMPKIIRILSKDRVP